MNTRVVTSARRTVAAIKAGDRIATATAATALDDAIVGALRQHPGDGYLKVLGEFARRAMLWSYFGYPRDEAALRTAIDAVVLMSEIEMYLAAKDGAEE